VTGLSAAASASEDVDDRVMRGELAEVLAMGGIQAERSAGQPTLEIIPEDGYFRESCRTAAVGQKRKHSRVLDSGQSTELTIQTGRSLNTKADLQGRSRGSPRRAHTGAGAIARREASPQALAQPKLGFRAKASPPSPRAPLRQRRPVRPSR